MKRVLILLYLFVLISLSALAQGADQRQAEIDNQVWKPFHAAFEARDAKALNALYAEQVLRVTPAGVDTRNLFKQQNIDSYANTNASGTKTSLDFWFESRQTSDDTSYEIGIFKITAETNGNSSTFYGQFHIVIKKIDGVWKITQDWDSPNINGRPITAKDFSRKSPLQF
ncbi:MAG: nuclear transport factor 2 family protein [Roseivirga sp.]|nr:nuclear transport factor 2 family protein [Roseivirga sp.]